MVLFHVQTVFEGARTNTPERGPKEAAKYEIGVPVGYDARVDGQRVSTIMHRFGTGGTPWTIVIDKSGIVRMNEVTPSVPRLEALIAKLRAEKKKN